MTQRESQISCLRDYAKSSFDDAAQERWRRLYDSKEPSASASKRDLDG